MLRRSITATLLAGALLATGAGASPPVYTGPLGKAVCGPGSLPEGVQGRVSAADVASGRAAKGYFCNTTEVGHFGNTGGYQVHRYVDHAGHVCAFYDSTILFGKDVAGQGTSGPGVYVMDMTDPAHPVRTTSLVTPAMLTPHESLRLNAKRGLLAAGTGNPGTGPGVVDVYDVSQDCRHPVLNASTPLGVLSHESAFAPDGRTFYVSSPSGHSLAAIDLADPKVPSVAWYSNAFTVHGMTTNDSGTRLYASDLDATTPGLLVLDVSEVQHRSGTTTAQPVVPIVSHLTWPDVSIPQNTMPVTIRGRHYLVEIDELNSEALSGSPTSPTARVGAARVIDINDDRHPRVVSNIRLAVHQASARAGDQSNDPGAQQPFQGYGGHYCAVPREVDPGIVACSFILSGLRVIDIHDPVHPKEVAYFNRPVTTNTTPMLGGSYALSAPAFVPATRQIWYTDGNSGLYVVRVNNNAWK